MYPDRVFSNMYHKEGGKGSRLDCVECSQWHHKNLIFSRLAWVYRRN
ncbi:hypothetical protein [Vibrio phage 27Ua.3]|nr:hypothetical protein [Vibrio phage 27Ua.3]